MYPDKKLKNKKTLIKRKQETELPHNKRKPFFV